MQRPVKPSTSWDMWKFRARGVVLTGFAEELGLKVVAEFIPEDTAIRIKGYLENLTERERAVDLQIRVYCDAKGALWARDTQVSTPIGDSRPSPSYDLPFSRTGSNRTAGSIRTGPIRERAGNF